MDNVTTVDHPLVQHKLTLMRDKSTSTKGFRQLMHEIATLLCYEVTRDLSLDLAEIETPMMPMRSRTLSGKKLVFAPILRAGLGLIEGMLDLVPSARVAHIGLYRDPESLVAVEYYFKSPTDLTERLLIVVDPMLATGNTAVAVRDRGVAGGEHRVDNNQQALSQIGWRLEIILNRDQRFRIAIEPDVGDARGRYQVEHALDQTQPSAQNRREHEFLSRQCARAHRHHGGFDLVQIE